MLHRHRITSLLFAHVSQTRPRGLLAALAVIAALAALTLAAPAASLSTALDYSFSSDRSGGAALTDGAMLAGTTYVFSNPDAPVGKVEFFLDGRLTQTEFSAPYDFKGGNVLTANPWDTKLIGDGTHTVAAKWYYTAGGSKTVSRSFTVQNSTASPPPPPPPPPAPSPLTPPPSFGQFTLLFEDNFDSGTEPNPLRWSQPPDCTVPPQSGCWKGNSGYGVRSGTQSFLRDGLLVLRAEMKGGTLFSGLVKAATAQTYGAYEFRVRTDDDPTGHMSGVVLLWPTTGGAIAGEQDMYETLQNHATWDTFVHYNDGGVHKQVYYTHQKHAREWTVVRYEWTPSSIRLYRDGVFQKEWTSALVIPDNLQRLSFQYDPWASSVSGPSEQQIDWVRVYTYAP